MPTREFYKSPAGKFLLHKGVARSRRIDFELTFEEWWDIWEKSGHWQQRGSRKGQYVMARYGDVGPYAIGNVKIITCGDNSREALARTHAKHRAATQSFTL